VLVTSIFALLQIDMSSKYSTKATWLGYEYGCRIFYNGEPILEGRAATRDMIGPVFRDLMRTLDKCGGDAYTHASRMRKFKKGNVCAMPKHIWFR
jgi:hypothetical protein